MATAEDWWDHDDPIYAETKRGNEKQATLFSDLAGVLKRNTSFYPVHTIKLVDLRKFNAEHRLRLRAYALIDSTDCQTWSEQHIAQYGEDKSSIGHRGEMVVI